MYFVGERKKGVSFDHPVMDGGWEGGGGKGMGKTEIKVRQE